jgi:hypothetical protein
MKISKKWLVGCLVVVAAGLFLNSSLMSEETYTVKPKPKGVGYNADIDYDDAESTVPESVETTENTITIKSKTFKPPTGSLFAPWVNVTDPITHETVTTYVDIWTVTGSTPVIANPDTSTAVKLLDATFPKNTAAFPLAGEGNFAGISDPAHWSVEIAKDKQARIVLEVNELGTADDYVAYGNNGGTLTVTVIGGTQGTSYSVALTDSGNGTPAGDINFSSTPVALTGPRDSKTVNLNGVTLGGVTITGACTNAIDGTTTAPVVPAVSKIQYQSDSTWVDISGTLYVMKGTTVTFKAIPNPADATWPEGKPVWGGTSGASGAGETKAVTFNTVSTSTANFKTVTAECGNTKTVNVIVYDLTSVHLPYDNFTGRSYIKYGVAEVAKLFFAVSPTGVTAAQQGGLRWSKVAGGGTVTSGATSGIGTYTAPATASNVTLRLIVQSGPSKNKYCEVRFSVVPPSDGYMIQKPGTNIWHRINTASVGFMGWSYLRPKDVSFTNIQRRENSCTGAGTGFYAYLNGINHPVGPWREVSNGNSTTGCLVVCDDRVTSGSKGAPYSVGEFTWPIPRQYRVGTGGAITFYTATHHQTANAIGTAQIEKAEAGPFSKKAGDASSDY